MRDLAAGGGNRVISIVERLERRALARLRDQAKAAHVREAELTVERFEGAKTIRETDYGAILAQLDGLATSDEVRVLRAKMRATRALQSCLRDDPDAGFAEWAETIAEAPDLVFPYLLRGRWRMATDPDGAMADYDRAAELGPTDPLVYWRRGDCLATMGDHDRALANYRRALALDPTSIDELQTMAKLLASRGEHAEAARAYDRAIALAPRYVDFYEGRARSRRALGDHEGAARDYGRVVEIDGARNPARFAWALCLSRAGHTERAVDEMVRLVALEPDEHHYHRTLGGLRLDQKRHAEAVEHLSRAIALAPDDALARALRARAHTEAGDRKSAVADFERAAELEPDEPRHLVCRAILRAADLPAAEVIADLDAVLARFPDNHAALVQRAELYFDEEEHERALADFDRALAQAPDDVNLLLDRALALAALGRLEQAMEGVARALVLQPDNPRATVLRAVFGDRLDHDPMQVEADYDRAVNLAPDDAQILATRAQHLQEAELHRAAIDDYDRALAIAKLSASLYYERAYSRLRVDEEMTNLEQEEGEAWEEPDDAREARLLDGVRDLERALELGLRTDEVFAELYNAHCLRDDLPAALAALDRGLSALPEAGLLLRFRHTLRKTLNDLDGASADKARGEALGMTFED